MSVRKCILIVLVSQACEQITVPGIFLVGTTVYLQPLRSEASFTPHCCAFFSFKLESVFFFPRLALGNEVMPGR